MRTIRILSFFFAFLFSVTSAAVSYAKIVPSLCRIHYPSDDAIQNECRQLKKGESLESLFGTGWVDVARFNRVDRRHLYPGTHIKVPVRLEEIKNFTPMPKFYQPAAGESKFVLVDLAEQFLGAYEYGKLVFSAPIASGEKSNKTPTGEFQITAIDSAHISSLYFVEKTGKLYPMHYGLRFYVNNKGIAFWIHGRDLPGYPASHGCIGLYDEEMQKKYYRFQKTPALEDAKTLFNWVVAPWQDDGKFHVIGGSPRVLILNEAPKIAPKR
jgi:hypothetical protein